MIWRLLKRLALLFGCECYPHHLHPVALTFSEIQFENYIVKGLIMAFSMRVDQTVTLTVTVVDKFGNEAVPTTPPVWSASNMVASIVPSADGMSCAVTPTGMGDSTVSAQMGTLSASLDMTFTAGHPASMSITAGSSVDQA